ncbi:MAG: proton-conducting transporter membrane subunit, partial [Acidimicrobiales bacterium]
MTLLVVLHALVGGAMLLGARWLGRSAFAVGAAPMVATLVWAGSRAGGVLDGVAVIERRSWVAGLDLAVALRLDNFGLLMVLVISGIGVAVMAYGASYFAPGPDPSRTAGLLVLFAGSMLGVVLADNVGMLYVAWELTSVTSWLLIGADHTSAAARGAALHALLVTSAGGLALLGGLVLVAQAAGTWTLSEVLADPPAGLPAGVGLGLILVGVVTKSAQYPF